jgi:exopolyphosphatase/guanosine-5'-triphosphate,3'-diphosphate pyrophosphatase
VETPEQRRLRHAACLLSDIGWRAHPDYRGIQSLNLVAHGTFVGVDHPGRGFLALTVYYRNEGLVKDELSQKLIELVDKDMLKRARILGAAFRAAHMVSAAMPGVLTNTPIGYEGNRLVWTLPDPYSNLEGERVERRFKELAGLLDREGEIRVGSSFQLAAS